MLRHYLTRATRALILIAIMALAATACAGPGHARGTPLILVPGTFGSWLESDIGSIMRLGTRGLVKRDWESHRETTFVNGGTTEAFGYVDPFADTYSDLIGYLTASGWKEGSDFWVFTYDTVRVGIQENASNLAALVTKVKARTGSDRVRIVAHSQGCLVARYYAECLGEGSVESLILLAPPNHGVVGVYRAKEVSDVGDFVFRLFLGATQPFVGPLKGLQAIWQMLPDIPYLYTNPSWFPGTLSELRADPSAISEYPQPELPVLNTLNSPENLKRLRGVSVYIVQGWGTNTDEGYEVGTPKLSSEVWEYGRFEKVRTTKRGDGIVLTAHLSTDEADWGDTSPSPRWVETGDGLRYRFIPLSGVRHTDYCRASAIGQWLTETGISEEPSTPIPST